MKHLGGKQSPHKVVDYHFLTRDDEAHGVSPAVCVHRPHLEKFQLFVYFLVVRRSLIVDRKKNTLWAHCAEKKAVLWG